MRTLSDLQATLEVRALLSNRSRWTTGVYGKGPNGDNIVDFSDPGRRSQVRSMCLVGAFAYVYEMPHAEAAHRCSPILRLIKINELPTHPMCPKSSAAEFNNTSSHEEVLAALDRTICTLRVEATSPHVEALRALCDVPAQETVDGVGA